MTQESFNTQYGSLFEFIPQVQTTQTSQKQINHIKSKSYSVDYDHVQNKTSNYSPFQGIVKEKNRIKEQQLQKKQKLQMRRTIQQFRTSGIGKQFNKTNGFFTQNRQKSTKVSISFQKQTEKIDKKHGLLRAMIKTKHEDGKYNQPDFYNQSFNRLQKGLKQIKLKEILSTKKDIIQIKQAQYIGLSHIAKYNTNTFINHEPISLSARTRIRLQNCKRWAIKHNKQSHQYSKRLSSSFQNLNQTKDTSKDRSRVLNSIRSFIK